jgi:small GTP-binding protein
MHAEALKAVLIGDSGVGKTSIFQRLESSKFSDAHIPTVGGAYTAVQVGVSERTIGLWDTAGQERFRTIVPMYFQRAHIVVIVFDLTQRQTFEHLAEWHEIAKTKAPENIKYVLIGNKRDCVDERVVTLAEAEEARQKIGGFVYIETSALNGDGFDLVLSEFGRLADEIDSVPDGETPVITPVPTPEPAPQRFQCC